MARLAAAALALLCAGAAHAARVPGSPYPVCTSGLNSTSTLWTYDVSSGSQDDAFTVMLLQGVLSKRQPRVYRTNTGSAYIFWLAQLESLYGVTVNTTYARDAAGLVAAFASELQGYVLIDMSDNSTNVAVAAAASMNVIPVTTANQGIATSAGLQMLYDVRGKDLAWALSTFNNTKTGFTYSKSLTVMQLASESCCMGDFSVAMGALQWWPPQDNLLAPLTLEVLGSMQKPFAMLGWGPDEYNTVTAVSLFGGGVVASNWAANLDVFANFDVPAFAQNPMPNVPIPNPPRHTVSFLMSDGDNVQFLIDGFATDPTWFGSPDRGSVPMGWTLSPSLADLSPVEMSYLYSNAASGQNGPLFRDVFVAGVSGFGYLYPDSVGSPQDLDALTALSSAYMTKADMRIVNILGHGEGYANGTVASYLAHDNIDAVVWYNYDDYAGLKGSIDFVNGKPVIGGRFMLWGQDMPPDPTGPTFKNVTGLAQALLEQARDPTSSAGYSLIPVHAWSHNVTDCRTVMDLVNAAAPGTVDFVAPDEFVRRIMAGIAH